MGVALYLFLMGNKMSQWHLKFYKKPVKGIRISNLHRLSLTRGGTASALLLRVLFKNQYEEPA